MSRKHNTNHPDRSRSNYPQRLANRGLSKAPALRSLEDLRRIQQARINRGALPWETWR
jgi:hypothetical protein